MSTTQDLKLAAMRSALGIVDGTGTINDLEPLFVASLGVAVDSPVANEAWMQYWDEQSIPPGQWNDRAFEFLGSIGHIVPGDLPGRWFLAWRDGFVLPPNLLINSRWSGASGSVGGANFIGPTDWDLGFWPPDDAIVQPDADQLIHFIAISNRGYVNQTIDVPPELVGEFVNLSAFIQVTSGSGRTLTVTQADVIRNTPTVSPGFDGRIDGVFQTTGPTISIRAGAGVSTNQDVDCVMSKVQLTQGDRLYAYQSTDPA